ncbi:hypothetical protein [Pelomonas sp. Root1444]|uniref:hypothetical protein n=1 Tax=Pelomonas sp. Root1444 TaxID=1736464 RepID=UPI0019104B85|nr:hypothetical protein [Pelomonas sp. Root1444]
MDSPAYLRLSHTARSLLLDIARQFVSDNNGRLLCSRAHLALRGWKSADVIDRAKRELMDAGLIHQTVQGHRPNRASWFAVTWQTLDRHPGYDPGAAATFVRGAYRVQAPSKNAVLSPSHGIGKASIGPSHGTETPTPCPSDGTISPVLTPLPVPSGGHHLETPSAGEFNADAEQGDRADDDSDGEPENTRERDGEMDARLFNPVTGEFDPTPEPRPQLAKQTACALVAAGLGAIKNRRNKTARHE